MANAAETLVSAGPEKERESGEYEVVDEAEVTFEDLEGDSLKEVEQVAKEAEEYAAKEGRPELVAQIKEETEAAKTRVRIATDEAAQKVGKKVHRIPVEALVPPERKSEVEPTAKKAKALLEGKVEGYARRISDLRDEERRTGASKAGEIRALEQAKLFAWRVAESPEALLAIGSAAVVGEKGVEALRNALQRQVSDDGIDPEAQEKVLESLAESKALSPEKDIQDLPTKVSFEDVKGRAKSVGGTLGRGAGRGLILAGTVVGATPQVAEKSLKAAGWGLEKIGGIFSFFADVLEGKKKDFGKGVEGALDWITNKLSKKKGEVKKEDKV